MRLISTIGVAICLSLVQASSDQKYCNEGRILWAQLRFYTKEIKNRVDKLTTLTAEFTQCRKYTETWTKWPRNDNTVNDGLKDVDRRMMVYRYQNNAICRENFDDAWRVGPSGVAFKNRAPGVPTWNPYSPSLVRFAQDGQTGVASPKYLPKGGPQKSQCLLPDYTTDGSGKQTGLVWRECQNVCSSAHPCDNGAAAKNIKPNGEKYCGTGGVWRTSDGADHTTTGNCVRFDKSFAKATYPKVLTRDDPKSRRLKVGNSQGQTNLPQLENGKNTEEASVGAYASHNIKRIQATGDAKNGWAWVGATRFCGAVNTMMNWISRQTKDIPEAEQFTKQEAWCNIVEEAIIHESLKTSEKREMGVLLNDKCADWKAFTSKKANANLCDKSYDCKELAASADYGFTPKSLANKFGNRIVAGGYSAEGYGHQNVARMLWSPTTVVAALALKHLGIDVTDVYGKGYAADKKRHEMLANDGLSLTDRGAYNLLQSLTRDFHYTNSGLWDTTGYAGGWHYGDRNWNNPNGIFDWNAAQTEAGKPGVVTPEALPTKFSPFDAAAPSTHTADWSGNWLTQNEDHGRAANYADNTVLPWNAGLKGHGTVAHEKQLRESIVASLEQSEELKNWMSGLTQDPEMLDAQVKLVKDEWDTITGLKTELGSTEENAARYAALGDFTLAGVRKDAASSGTYSDSDAYGGDIGRNRAVKAGWEKSNFNINGGSARSRSVTVGPGAPGGMIGTWARVQNMGQSGQAGGQANTYMGNGVEYNQARTFESAGTDKGFDRVESSGGGISANANSVNKLMTELVKNTKAQNQGTSAQALLAGKGSGTQVSATFDAKQDSNAISSGGGGSRGNYPGSQNNGRV